MRWLGLEEIPAAAVNLEAGSLKKGKPGAELLLAVTEGAGGIQIMSTGSLSMSSCTISLNAGGFCWLPGTDQWNWRARWRHLQRRFLCMFQQLCLDQQSELVTVVLQ